jgi:hypothetical protein
MQGSREKGKTGWENAGVLNRDGPARNTVRLNSVSEIVDKFGG